MHRERWQRARGLFEQALEIATTERAEFLDRNCLEDPELRREVDSLLEADGAASGFLEAGLAPMPSLRPPLNGKSIGAYRLEEIIGEGGMSIVYRASRADDEYRQQVAIKVQVRGLGSEHLKQRFRSERQILAGLAHPHIARLLDGGTTDDGSPYVVMEYVEGLSITEYCDHHRLSIDARLELFRKVCDAVHYAHQNLIVHRDLKPSNILVIEGGSPKLLDFGIAKLLGPERGSEDPKTTVAWLRLMTPSYASPEQAQGGVITTASDVYSLGVLLYRLLSGHAPYCLMGRSAAEVERFLQEVEPPLASTARFGQEQTAPADDPLNATPEQVSAARGLRPEGLRRRLRGDLDTIIAKAMHKRPERRYVSAEGLAEDLRRHLGGLPVTAQRDSFAYRGGKFLRRHLLEVTAVTIIVGLIVAFAFTTRIQSQIVAEERDQVRAERDKNAEVLHFLMDIFETSSPEISGGETITAREILDRGAQRIDSQLTGRPDTRATLLLTVGNVNYSLGRYEVARDLLLRAVEARRQLPADEPTALAESLYFLGRALLKTSEPKAAETAFSEALEVARRRSGEGDKAVVQSLRGLAEAARVTGDLEASEELFRQAMASEQQFSGSESLSFTETIIGLARTQLERGEYQEAQALSEQALAIERKLLDENNPRLALSLQRLSEILFQQDDLDRAEALSVEALTLQERVLGPNHSDLRLSLNSLADVALARQDYDRAENLFRRALAISREAFAADDPRLAVALNNLGKCLWRAGNLEGAEPVTRESLAIYRRIWGGEHPDLASSAFNMGVLLQERGNIDEAQALYRETLEILRRTMAPDQHTLAFPLIRLGNLLSASGSPEEAEPLLREALAVRRKVLPEGHRLTAMAAGNLGINLVKLAKYSEAEPLLLQAYTKRLEGVDPSRADTWRRELADLYRVWGRPEEAARYSLAPPQDSPP